ncbi:hypothetical protein NX059_009612 [Plenodomus lindquistii]|nr:hypothetical protein NX059_009612 [Plenodomus lindquistii]
MRPATLIIAFLALASGVFTQLQVLPGSTNKRDIDGNVSMFAVAPVARFNSAPREAELTRDLATTPSSAIQVAADWDPNEVATPAEIQEFASKGNRMRCLLDMTDALAGKEWPDPLGRTPASASSPWTIRDFRTWYWFESEYAQDNCYFGGAADIGPALEGLGLNIHPKDQGGDTICYSIEHVDDNDKNSEGEAEPEMQQYHVGGKEYTATGAYYRFGINHKSGAIIGRMSESPYYAAETNWDRTPNIDELPALRLGSDIVHAYWLKDNPSPQNLRYYFATNIQNADTLAMIASVLKTKGIHDDIPLWPGVEVHYEEPEFEMLLGTPIGRKLGFLLLQHKADLGIKRVTEIVVFGNSYIELDDNYMWVHMLFKIGDVEDPVGQVSRRSEKLNFGAGVYVNGVRTHMLLENTGFGSTAFSHSL